MLLRLLVFFYFAFVAQPSQYQNVTIHDSEDLIRRQTPIFGLSMFDLPNFRGTSVVSTDASVENPIHLGASIEFLGNAYAIVTSTSDNTTTIFWDSIADTSTLPLKSGRNVITSIQSSGCTPPCSSGGTCNPSSPVCTCLPGFTGTQCESCATGHFGPSCKPCPSKCNSTCDDGTSGSGICLFTPSNGTASSNCTCVNGSCNREGGCDCLPGWSTSSNGTLCAQCSQGSFVTPNGGCQICPFGCSICENQSGACTTCLSGFTKSSNPSTCTTVPILTSSGETCPKHTFRNPQNTTGCLPCAGECASCTGPSSNDCIVCASPKVMLNNSCVTPNEFGICANSNGMIADNVKNKCEGCGSIEPNCVSCQIKNFNVASTINQAKCTGCLAGFLLSNGKCVTKCPTGTFATNNVCKNCSSSCHTCSGAPDNCISCKNGFVLSGKCVSECPAQNFVLKDTCTACHPDCGSCNGTSFTECLSCAQTLPALQDGRCLATCANSSQFIEGNTCRNCHPSCASCSGPGPGGCLTCTNPSSFIVVNGTCITTPFLISPGKS